MKAGRLLFMTAAIGLAVVACNRSDSPAATTGTTEDEDEGVVAARTQVLDDLGRNVIIPGYLNLAENTAGLRSDLESGCASPTGDIEHLRQSWLISLDNWLAIQSYRFGPLEDLDLGATIFYPIDPAKVDQNAAAGVGDLDAVGSDARGLGAMGAFSTRPTNSTKGRVPTWRRWRAGSPMPPAPSPTPGANVASKDCRPPFRRPRPGSK